MTRLLDVVTGHAAASVLYGLLRAGVLDRLRTPHTAAEVAVAHRLDAAGTEVALDFVARTTGVVRRARGRFVLAPTYARGDGWRALLEKFVGAYGDTVRDPIARLRDLDQAGAATDRAALTRAYAWDVESPAVVQTLVDLAPAVVLDVGCGRGALLAQVCGGRAIRGIGVDPSAAMVRAARAGTTAAGLADRISIRRGGVLDLGRVLTAAERRAVSVVHGGSLLNELVRDEAVVVATLARLGRWFPKRTLVVVDYLGALGQRRAAGPCTYLNDLVQALSGQGVPPSTHDRWAALYVAAGARLVEAAEGRTFDLRWFVHVIHLGDPVQ